MDTSPRGAQTYSPAMVTAKNYQRWIFDALARAARGRLLEIGVGSAPFVSWYENATEWIAADIDALSVEQALLRWHELYPGRNAAGLIADAGSDAFWQQVRQKGPLDGIICVNVLEHLSDDAEFFMRAHETLAVSHGRLGLFVPAMPAIFGSLDEAAGHYRRYTKRRLKALAERARFTIEELRYFNAPGALLWWWQGRVRRTKNLTDPGLYANIGRFDRYAVPVIQALERPMPPLFGQSLVLIVRA